MARKIDPERLAGFNTRQRAIIAAANDWGYLDAGLCREELLYRGRKILDIGMGGGPHSVAFIVGGAVSYAGVDPMVGSTAVSDFRAMTNPTIPSYHEFPYSIDDIMSAFPNIRLYSGYMEELSEDIRTLGADFIALSNVTEHLEHPHEVIKAAYDATVKDALIWLSHANYYSWSGHHFNPRTLETWDRGEPDHNANADWKHLDPGHHAYAMQSLNRMRLDDFRALIGKYFN